MPRVKLCLQKLLLWKCPKEPNVERKGGGIVQIIQEKKRIEQTYFSICSQKRTCLCGLNKVRLVRLLYLVLYRNSSGQGYPRARNVFSSYSVFSLVA